ncbi:hypothetical protein LIER_03570 [Lithospermum erythrorhizon]|uniref:Uncharacterized protein n=1 Tax=Lithospermum erythrorhizon TaxID=34254 RepID=A0AAV3NTS1_LITER
MRSLCDLRDTLVAMFGGRAEVVVGLEGCCVGVNWCLNWFMRSFGRPVLRGPPRSPDNTFPLAAHSPVQFGRASGIGLVFEGICPLSTAQSSGY